MGCCNSIPHREENTRSTINNNVIREQSTIGDANIKKPEAAVTSSLNSTDNAEKKEPYGSPQPLPSLPPSSGNPYPILVRLSSDGQDITIQLPTEPPYLSVAALKQQLLLYTTANNIKLIYLGRILSDQYLIAPTGSPITPKNHKTTIIQIQKECVLQAMISKVP